jgi:hypothetical protein
MKQKPCVEDDEDTKDQGVCVPNIMQYCVRPTLSKMRLPEHERKMTFNCFQLPSL